MTNQFKISDQFFLKPINNELFLWDYANHRQYKLDRDYAIRLVELITGIDYEKSIIEHASEVDNAFRDSQILTSDSSSSNQWGWDVLAKIFHIGTSNIPQDHNICDRQAFIRDYQNYSNFLNQKIFEDLNQNEKVNILTSDWVNLPKAEAISADFLSVLKSRRTIREFIENPVEIEKLSSILHYAANFIHEPEERFALYKHRKSSPSAGNVHTEEIYLFINNVSEIPRGLFKYLPHHHALAPIPNACDWNVLRGILQGQFFGEHAAFGLFICSDFSRSWFKYPHSRGYRSVLLDIGHLSQSIQLCCTSVGLGTWITGAFHDAKVMELLGIENEYPIFFLASGYSTGKSLPADFEV